MNPRKKSYKPMDLARIRDIQDLIVSGFFIAAIVIAAVVL